MSVITDVLVGVSIGLNLLVLKRLSWQKNNFIPWFKNISDHVNPTHSTAPGDV
jgi:hypothetical protein